MDRTCARILNETNRRFYEAVSASFSETRANPWPGWVRVIDEVEAASAGFAPREVIDIACGNLRFEKFLTDRMGAGITFHTLDSCDPLVECGAQEVSHQSIDLVDALLDATLEEKLGELGQADLVVSFGFFHHVPGFEARARLLRVMVDALRPGGFAVLSLWRFMEDLKLAAKAREMRDTALSRLETLGLDAAQLEEDDWLLGWQDSDAIRYCHHFPDEEVDALKRSARGYAELVADFTADGKGGNLNRYLVLRKPTVPERNADE